MTPGEITLIGFGLTCLLFARTFGRWRAAEMGGSAEANARRGVILALAVIALALADCASVSLGWGSFLGSLNVRF